jgi:hypothetical protein
MDLKGITEGIIGAAIEVHRALGPGLLESAYEECLCHELWLREIPFERQRPPLLKYKGLNKLGRWKLGLLINFNVPVLKDGIRRVTL